MNFKHWKYRAVFGVVAILALGFAFVACGDKGGGDPSVAVQSVTLNPSTLELTLGGPSASATIIAVYTPIGATDKTVTWSSSDTSKATVVADSQLGVAIVTGVAPGQATITVTTKNGKTATCAVTVRNANSITIPVTDVTLSDSAFAVVVGNNRILTATIEPANATNKNVTWESSDPTKASVTAQAAPGTAMVVGLVEGTTTITVKTADGNKTAECEVTVEARALGAIDVTGVTVAPKTYTLTLGGTITTNLTATILPLNATYQGVDWVSSDTNVATVVNSGDHNHTGIVTAVGPGTAIIKAITDDGEPPFEDSCTITVNANPNVITSITLSEERLDMIPNQEETLSVTVLPTNATKNLTWSSDDEDVATVDQNGKVTAIGVGEATITVASTANNSIKDTCDVYVTLYAVDVEDVQLNKAELELFAGEWETLIATVLPINAHDKSVTWESSDDAIATVSNEQTVVEVDGEDVILPAGTVTGVGVGEATITVTTEDGGFTAECEVSVKAVLVSSVTVSPKTLTLAIGTTTTAAARTLSASVSPTHATNKTVTWSSDTPARAVVNATTGVVTIPTGATEGTATITATANDGSGKTDTCTVDVQTAVTGIGYYNNGSYPTTPLSGTLPLGFDEVLTYAQVQPLTAIRTLKMVSSNTNAVIVEVGDHDPDPRYSDYEVVLKCVGLGTAVVTITSDGIKADGTHATNTITIEVIPVPVTGVSLNKTALGMNVGDTETLTATVAPPNASNKAVTWSIAPEGVATVSQAGLVTAVAGGSATITAKTVDGNFSATCAVSVIEEGEFIVMVQPNTLYVAVEGKKPLTAVIMPEDFNIDDKTVTWSSGNTNIATVSTTGVVTGIGVPGYNGTTVTKATVTITATSNKDNEKTATCIVTVDYGMSENMVRIPATTTAFQMGSPTTEQGRPTGTNNVEPQHNVTLSQAYYIGDSPVMQFQYKAITGVNPSYYGFEGEDDEEFWSYAPVEFVTWFDAVTFCNMVSEREGFTKVYTITGTSEQQGIIYAGTVTANWNNDGYRLPTEAEWEYACRAGTTTPYAIPKPNGSTSITAGTQGDTARFGLTTGGYPVPAYVYNPNAWDLYSMHGNVSEWCWDWYGTLSTNAATNPRGATTGNPTQRVLRGGNYASANTAVRSASRSAQNPGYYTQGGGAYFSASPQIGFRIARNAPALPSTKMIPGTPGSTAGSVRQSEFAKKWGGGILPQRTLNNSNLLRSQELRLE